MDFAFLKKWTVLPPPPPSPPGGGKRSLWKCEVICSMDQPVIEPPRSRQQAPRTLTVCLQARATSAAASAGGRQADILDSHPSGLLGVNFGRVPPGVLSPVRRGEVLQGSFTDRGRLRFLEIRGRIPGGGADADSHFRSGDITLPRHPLFHQGKQSPLFAHEPRVSLNIYHVSDLCVCVCVLEGGRRGGGVPETLHPLRPATLNPVIEARKCACHLLPLGHG